MSKKATTKSTQSPAPSPANSRDLPKKGSSPKRKTRSRTPAPKDKVAPSSRKPTTPKAEAKSEAKAAPAAPKVEKQPRPQKPQQEPKAGSLADLRVRFCTKLLELGKSEGTARSYAADLNVACKHFGGEKQVSKLTQREVEDYLGSDRVNLGRNGQRRNQITIDKVTRVFRQAIEFAVSEGWLKKNPLPAQERRSKKKVQQAGGEAAKSEESGA